MNDISRFLWIVLWMTLTFSSPLPAQTIPLLSQPELDPYGLKRVWFSQIKLHPAEGKVQNILLEGGQLLITTSDAKLHVYNSETGEWLWTRSIGSKDLPLTEPAVNSRIVAIHNNLAVFLFNRKTGKQLLQIPLPDAAAAACEMSEYYLYVPMVDQTLLAFILKEAFDPQISPDGADEPIGQHTTIDDPELKKIVQQFKDAKRMLRAAEPGKPDTDRLILDSTHRIPITCASFGSLRTKPLFLSQFYFWKLDEEEEPTHEIDKITHQEFVSWITEQGFLYTAKITSLSEKYMELIYRVDSAGRTFYLNQQKIAQIDRPGNKELLKRPALSQLYPVNELDRNKIIVPGMIIAGGRAAYVFAVDARSGDIRWRYPARGQILESIAVIGRDIYAPTANGILHALDFQGKERWSARNVKRFVAASQKRVYVLDMRDRLVCLDRASGASVFVYNIQRFEHCLFNLETDQIFLLTDSGLVQCLRERQFAADRDAEPESGVSLRHRISCAEFREVANGGEMPKLWWIEE